MSARGRARATAWPSADAIRASAGSAAIARIASALGHKYNGDAAMAAIRTEDIPCLAVLRTSKTPIKNKRYEAVARYGRVDALAWLFVHEGIYSWHSHILAVVAQHGHLACLKWAHQPGATWDEEVAVAAARGGHVDCLAYARDYGCRGDLARLTNRRIHMATRRAATASLIAPPSASPTDRWMSCSIQPNMSRCWPSFFLCCFTLRGRRSPSCRWSPQVLKKGDGSLFFFSFRALCRLSGRAFCPHWSILFFRIFFV
nr:Ankyrin repeat domain containing protein [Pandoravirus belohorizontensis]